MNGVPVMRLYNTIMNILFDARWLGRTGIGRYTEELLTQLQQLDHKNKYYVLLLPQHFDSWQPAAPNFHPVRTTAEVYTWQEQLLLPWQIWRLKPDLAHFTSFNLPILYPGRFVATIHDLTLVHFKNVRSGLAQRLAYELKYWVMRGILRVVTNRAERIIAPCEFTKDDILRHYGISPTQVTVTYEAVGKAYDKPEPLKLPDKFIMYLGNTYPYKNIGRLIEAFATTKARHRGTKLVLAGHTPYFTDQLKAQVKRLGLERDVLFVGRISDGEAATAYQQTQLFVFPSMYEGFGLMGLEAMTLGAPVLAARASCLPEIYEDAAAYCDPTDPGDIARQIDALLDHPERLEELRAAGRRQVKKYSWKKMAKETLAVYDGSF
jgi:glycosyltransferase involved in cell wall biosynthesis